MKGAPVRSLIRYRFKDNMGYVFFKEFPTDKEARLWYEQNKIGAMIKEFNKDGIVHKVS